MKTSAALNALPKLVPIKNNMTTSAPMTLPKLVPLDCHKKEKNTVPPLVPLQLTDEENKLPRDLGSPMKMECDSCGGKMKKKEKKNVGVPLPPLIPLEACPKKKKCVKDDGFYSMPDETKKMATKLPELIPLTAEEKMTTSESKEFSLKESTIDRMATVFRYDQSIANTGMKSLMTNGTFPLAASNECKTQQSLAHMKSKHRLFYDILEKFDLLAFLKMPDIAIIIPSEEALKMVNPKDEGVKDILLYHFLKVGAMRLQSVPEGQMIEIPTMDSPKMVQIEKFKDAYFINGVQAIRSDIFCPFQIYHVKSVLIPGTIIPLIPVTKEKDEKDDSDSSNDDDSSKKEENKERVMTENSFIYQSFQSSLLQNVNEKTTLKNSVLKDVALQMNKSIYNSSALNASQSTKTLITLAAFNTGKLYDDYKAQSMIDMSRIFPRRLFELQFNNTTPINYDSQLTFNEYQCRDTMTPINKSDLLNGPVMISVKQAEGKVSHVLCKFISSSRDTNTYIDVNENVLVRFDADGKLDTLSLNHDALKADGSMTPDFNHFIELNVNEHYDALFHSQLGKNAFDTLLMTNGKFGRGVKKYVKRGIDKAKRVYQQQVAIRLRPVQQLPDALQNLTEEQGETFVSMVVKRYTKSHVYIDDSKPAASSKSVKTKNGTAVMVYEFSEDKLQPGTGFVSIKPEAGPTTEFDLRGVSSKNNIYYGVNEVTKQIYVVVMDGADVRTIYIMKKDSREAKAILGK